MEKLLMEIKEKLVRERHKNPLLTFKDSPSLVIALIFLIQFITQNDLAIKDFINLLFKKLN